MPEGPNVVESVADFFVNPIGGFIHAVGSAGQHHAPPTFPIAVNPETGEVTVLISRDAERGHERALEVGNTPAQRNRIPGYQDVELANRFADALQGTFDGQRPALGAYEWARNDLAILGVDYRANLPEPPEPTPFEPPPNFPALFSAGGRQYSPVGPEDFFMPRFVRSLPVGGFAGFANQTVAGQLSSMPRGAVRRVRRTRTRATPMRRRRRAAAPTRKRVRLVKGSAAAKRYMAKIRRMRKRR